MTPWDDPHSAADGILDDETYDWLGVFDVDAALAAAAPLVAPEAAIVAAHELGVADRHPGQRHRHRRPRRPPDRRRRAADPGERVAVIFSGVAR